MRQATSDRGSLTVGRFHRTRLISLEKKAMLAGVSDWSGLWLNLAIFLE